MTDHQSSGSRVYFIAAVGTDLVKIGHSANITVRMRSLACSSPVALVLLASMPGGVAEEAKLHEILSEYRSHGEWFRRTKMLDDLIAAADQPAVRKRIASGRHKYLQEYFDELRILHPVPVTQAPPPPRYGWHDGHFCRLP